MKKLIALLLAVMMLVTLVACTKAPADTTTKAPVSGNEGNEGNTGDETKESVTVKWVTLADQPKNTDAWHKMVNDYIEPLIGVKVEIVWVDGDTKNLMWQTGADWDIMFGQGGDITPMVEAGVTAPINDLLPEVPALQALLPSYMFDAVSWSGDIMAIPAYKDFSHSEYWIWEKAVVDEYYPEYTEVHDFAGVYEALKAIRDGGCDWLGMLKAGGFGNNGVLSWNYDSINSWVGINYQNGTEYVNVFEQDDVKANLDIISKLYHEGYVNQDNYLIDSTEGSEYIVSNGWGWPSAAITAWPRDGRPVVVSQFEYTVVSTSSIRGSYLMLNINSTKKVESMKVIELLNTDTYMRDLFWYGEEGYNWDYIEEDGAKKVHRYGEADGVDGWTYAAYTQGSFFNVTPQEGSLGFGEIEELNQNAVPSPAMGFVFVDEPIRAQLDACNSIWAQYEKMITCGVDVSLLDQAMDELYAAGLQDIIDEANRQFDEWKVANGK